MAVGRRSRVPFVVRSKRKTFWSQMAESTAFVTVAPNTFVLDTVFTPTVIPETLIRSRGVFAWRSDVVTASEDQFGAWGIKVTAPYSTGDPGPSSSGRTTHSDSGLREPTSRPDQ